MFSSSGGYVATYRAELLRILLNCLGIQNLSVVFASLKILVVVLREHDLLLVKAQLQVGRVVNDLLGNLLASRLLLLAFLLLLFELLCRLNRLPCKVPR